MVMAMMMIMTMIEWWRDVKISSTCWCIWTNLQTARERVSQIETVWIIIEKLAWKSMNKPQEKHSLENHLNHQSTKKYFLCLGLDGSPFATSAHCLRFWKRPPPSFIIVHSPYSRDYGGNPKKSIWWCFVLKSFFWTSATDVFRSNLTQQWSNSSDRKLIAPFQINSRATTNFDFHRYKVIELF